VNQPRTPTLYEARIRQQAIGSRLRRLFDDFVEEPTPPEFSDILRQADQGGLRSAIHGAAVRPVGHARPFDDHEPENHEPEPAPTPVAEPAPTAPPPLDLATIGRLAHEMNRSWCELNGDHSQPPWDQAPQWQRDSTMEVVRFFAEHPEAGDDAMHQAWLNEKQRTGWVYGAEKDPELKTHPCIVPFEQLPIEQQFKDRLFRTVVGVGLGLM